MKHKLGIHCVQTCLRNSGPSRSGSSKHFSNSPRKKLKESRERSQLSTSESEQVKQSIVLLCACLILLVPVVDLVDVAKHDFVFSLHIIRDTLLLHLTHVTLIMETHKHINTTLHQGVCEVKRMNSDTLSVTLKC